MRRIIRQLQLSLDELELEILRTPTSEVRNQLTDANIHGKEACGSMVSFYKGLPDKNKYRRFRIRTVSGIDDYAMLREVVHRHYRRVLEEKLTKPDFILIDGGKAHLLVAKRELDQLGMDIPLASIAKEEENIYKS